MINQKFTSTLIFFLFGITLQLKAQTIYFNSFKGSDASGIVLGGDAFLTSGNADPLNKGYLRLTPKLTNKSGFAYIDQEFLSTQGIKVEFEFSSWGGGEMADGIAFFLFDPKDGFGIGQYGGALGYAQNKNDGTGKGMKNGFLAVGLDEYGNFGAATETKNGGFKDKNGVVYTSAIQANGLVTVRGGVGPNGEQDGLTAYPFLGGKITNSTFGSTKEAWPTDLLSSADRFNIGTNQRDSLETGSEFRKIRLDIQRIVGTGFLINVDIFVGGKGRWIKVLENFPYQVPGDKVPTMLKAGFSASTGFATNHHDIRNVLITPSAAALNTPTAGNDVINAIKNQVRAIEVLANDNPAINAGIFQQASLDLDPSTPVVDNMKSVTGGIFTADNTGKVTFTPTTDFIGAVPAVSYVYKDSFGITSTIGTISVTVSVSNTLPTVADFSKSGQEDNAIPFLASDFSFNDVDGNPLNKVKIVNLPDNGVLKINGSEILAGAEIAAINLNNLSFIPNANWSGITTFKWNGSDDTSYAIQDAVSTLQISAVNDIPFVRDIQKSSTEDTELPFSLADFSAKFDDVDNSLSTLRINTLPPNGILKLASVNVVLNQEIPATELGKLSFKPNANWNGTSTFIWNATDGTSYAAVPANVTISITAVNDVPAAKPFAKDGTEDTAIIFTSADFKDSFFDPEATELTRVKIISLPANGKLRLNGIEVVVNQEILPVDLTQLSFSPDLNWTGSTSFLWSGQDGTFYSQSGLVTINIAPIADQPSVNDFSKQGTEDEVLNFSLVDFRSNFNDPDNDGLTSVKIVSLPMDGSLTLNGTAVTAGLVIPSASVDLLRYTPPTNWSGKADFKWNGSDGISYAALDKAIEISILPLNDAPDVQDIDKSGGEDQPISFSQSDFTSTFTDAENDLLSKIRITSLPVNGKLTLNGAELDLNQEIGLGLLDKLIFTPNPDFNGSSTFNWTASDGKAWAGDAKVNISITGVIDDPVAADDVEETSLDKSVQISVLDNDRADQGLNIDKSSITIMAQARHGELKVDANGLITYTPANRFAGSDSFTYMIQDSNGNTSNIANVNISVTGFFISNVFTPNGDGKNDTFVIAGIENYDVTDLTVYNRWGNEVYRNSNYRNNWDGFGLNQGTYYFVAKLKKGTATDVRKGWILLKR